MPTNSTQADEALVERDKPLHAFFAEAEDVVNSPSVIGIYAACEWDELNDDGKCWIAGIVREVMARAAIAALPKATLGSEGELLPCPFCGGTMEAVRSEYTGNVGWVQHVDDEQQATCPLEFGGLDDRLPDIVAAWNARVLTPPADLIAEAVEYEVWQKDAFGDGDAIVAGSTSLAEAQHYAAVYGQDGPAWVVKVVRTRLNSLSAQTKDSNNADG